MRQKSNCLKLLFLVFLLLPAISSAETINGKVVSVADGDTITVLTPEHKQIKIRLAAVDTPEKKQAYGQKAKDFTAARVAGKNVTIKPETTDKYGRTVGFVFVDGTNRSLNEQIVADGYGWVYRKYCQGTFCADWLQSEKKARETKIGLWAESNPIPPWEWRHTQKGSDVDNQNTSNEQVAVGKGVYHGNTSTHVFHGPRCQHYNCKNCTVILNSIQEAEKSGYRAHKDCVQ